MNTANSFSCFWWRCIKTAWGRSWRFFSHARGVAAIVAFVVVAFGGYRLILGIQPQMSLLITIGPVCAFACVFLFHLMKVPRDFYAEAASQAENIKTSLTAKIEDLQRNRVSELATLREGHQPLELDVSCRKVPNHDNFVCILTVRNSSETASADEVTVQLLDIFPAPPVARPNNVMEYLAVKDEYRVPVQKVIHPKATADFAVFTVTTEQDFGLCVRFRVALRGTEYNRFYQAEKANNSTEAEGLPPRLKDYSFRVAVSARGRPQVIQEFRMRFSTQERNMPVVVSKA